MVNQTKLILKLALVLMLFSLHVDAFDVFIQSAYKQDDELNQLKKQYELIQKQTNKNELENALTYGYNKKTSLHVSILEKQKNIMLSTIIKYFTVLSTKKISLIYDENNQIQNKKYSKALNKFKNYTGLDFKNTNLEKIIKSSTIPTNNKKAYQLFRQLSINEKRAISNILKIDDTKNVYIRLRSYYNQYINMLNNLKNKIDKLKEQSNKENFTFAQTEYIQQNYKVLFQKTKILFVIGVLESKFTKSIGIKKTKNEQKKAIDVKLKRIHFVGNSSEVSSYSINIVEEHAKKLLKLKNFTLELHGYSDSFGNIKDNYRLSKERVEKTKEALVKFGLNPEKIKLFYYGDKNPIKTNETEQGRLLNRRVEFKVTRNNNGF